MFGRWRLLVVVALVAACAGPTGPTSGTQSQAGPSQASPSETPSSSGGEQPLTLVYTGTITQSRVGYSNATQIGITRDLELTWTLTYTGPLTFNEHNLPPEGHRVWSSVNVSGSIVQVGYDGFGQPTVQCSGTYVSVDDLIAQPLLQNPSDTGDPRMISLRLVAPTVGAGAKVVGDCDGDPNGYGSPSYPSSANVTEISPHASFDVVDGGTQDFDRTLDYNDGTPTVPDDNHLEIHSTVSLSPIDDSCQVAAAPGIELAASRTGGQTYAVAAGEKICPIITWVNAPGGEIQISRQKAPPVPIGSRVELRADLCCGGDPTGHAISWTIGGDAVAGYDVDDPIGSHGTITPLPRTMTSRSVAFYWYAGTSWPVLLSIDKRQAPATLDIDRPTADLNADKVCQVGLRTAVIGKLPLPAFGLGLNSTCADSGISWTANALGDLVGSLAMIQLYTDDLRQNGADCPIRGGKPGFAADNHTFYKDYLVGADKVWSNSDSPAFSMIGRVGYLTRSFQASDYLMFKFGGRNGDSIWVPLRKLTWSWSATVAGNSYGWSVTEAHNPPASIRSVDWGHLPTWTWVDTNDNEFVCP